MILQEDIDFIEHAGVKGMKWGVRKDPKRSSSSGKPEAKAGVVDPATIYVASMLATYGALGAAKFLDSGNARVLKEKGKRFATLQTGGPKYKKNEDLAKKNLSEDELMQSVVKPINPGFGDFGTKMNCRRATIAYEMRRRGYDVKATKSVLAQGQHGIGLRKAVGSETSRRDWGENTPYLSVSIQPPARKIPAENLFRVLKSEPNGSRGEVTAGWRMGGGHSVAYEIVRGKPVIFDTQSGTKITNADEWVAALPAHVQSMNYTRLDNKPINTAWVERWVQNND